MLQFSFAGSFFEGPLFSEIMGRDEEIQFGVPTHPFYSLSLSHIHSLTHSRSLFLSSFRPLLRACALSLFPSFSLHKVSFSTSLSLTHKHTISVSSFLTFFPFSFSPSPKHTHTHTLSHSLCLKILKKSFMFSHSSYSIVDWKFFIELLLGI